MSAKTPAKGHTAKHVHRKKHAGAKAKHKPVKQHKPVPAGSGHNVHTVAHHPKPAKPRGLALDGLPVCAAEAVAMSLRLAGRPVSDDEVAWLWELAGGAAAGATVAAALDAASLHGLAGFRPELAVDLGTGCLAPVDTAEHVRLPVADCVARALHPFEHFIAGHALILGVNVPGPHCVLATPAGWWSWGKLWTPWPARIEEAWAVTWHDR